MILLNFSHPLTDAQLAQITELTGQPPTRVLALMPHFDEQQPFAPQLTDLMAQFDLTATQWQSEPILVVLPSLNFIAGLLLAELHGCVGYFPPIVRTRPMAGSVSSHYRMAKILDLQALSEATSSH